MPLTPAGMKAQGKAPHSVFTLDLIDAPGQPTRRAVDEVIAFFRKALLKSSTLRDELCMRPVGCRHGAPALCVLR